MMGDQQGEAFSYADLIAQTSAVVAVVWYVVIWLIGILGHVRIRTGVTRKLVPGSPRAEAVSATLDQSKAPGVTVIRPIKSPGKFQTEPHLIECLLTTVQQRYPRFELILTVADVDDPAIPGIHQLIRDHPGQDVSLIIGDEKIGINPKINNLVRGWRKAKYDIIWIVDCNVWLDHGAMGRTVDVLLGHPWDKEPHKPSRRPAKVVHHLPICVNTTGTDEALIPWTGRFDRLGCALEEAFLSSSHAKFYVGINTVAIAPCMIGKSNMFRKSHLMELCPKTPYSEGGIACFSSKLCEDHLIAEHLWKYSVKDDIKYNNENNTSTGLIKHQLLNEPCFQPMNDMSLYEYWTRRSRWLTVRKFSVLGAALVEPGTECFLGSYLGGVGLKYLDLLPVGWTVGQFWLASVAAWCLSDWFLYQDIHRYATVDKEDPNCPVWLKIGRKRSIFTWFLQWFGREALALPVWFNGMLRGDVNWRGNEFSVTASGVRQGTL
ncbi:hypothetical protein TWF102_000688 [Orbilia oligospora]|uniref:Ceramide glucosyltransferase n=1 Tax=Orbilia oligospora TaxID=2813651 RepID=A0A7C8NI22_ORBOL|nr:hypothetical protein TWF102_000688 [Orbilia oligospora]KAF3103641.1 hypothetical protein TWF103_007154 [Orbilia oligospora]